MVWTISEMAKKLSIAPSTLRYYDKEGLLPFIERSSSGIRVFTEKDYELLKIIECLKKTGMQIKDIRKFIHMLMQGDETIDARLELFVRQREIVSQRMKQMQEMLDIIEFKCWYYETAQKIGGTFELSDLPDAEFPERFRAIHRKLSEA